MEWAEKYMKTDFSKMIFTDECRATLDGPDGWARGSVSSQHSAPVRLRRQQGGGGVMLWGAIVGESLVCLSRVEDGVKINSEGYCKFLDKNFLPWWKKQPLRIRKALLFMHDNAPSHASALTKDWLTKHGIKDEQRMLWPPCSPDLNPIENLWSIIKQSVYANGKQYTSKDDLWHAVKAAADGVSKETINGLTSSVDRRLISVIQKKGGYVSK